MWHFIAYVLSKRKSEEKRETIYRENFIVESYVNNLVFRKNSMLIVVIIVNIIR